MVIIDHESLRQYRALVDAVSPNEVQWYSMVNRAILPAKKGYQSHPELRCYYVDGMMIPKQKVSGGEVDTSVRSDPSTMMCIFNELKEKHVKDNGDYNMDAVNADIQRMHVWCHSHPFAGEPSPSGTDKNTFRDWIAENAKIKHDCPNLMLIFGKSDYIYAAVYDPRVPGMYFEEVPVMVEGEKFETTPYIEDAIANKIEKARFSGYSGWNSDHWVKGKDGSYVHKNSPAGKKLVDNKIDPETKAMEFFLKKDPGFEDNLAFINMNYQCSDEVKAFWETMKSWLKTKKSQTMFTLALTSTEDLMSFETGLDDSMACTGDECLIALDGWFNSSMTSAVEIKSCLTFAKRFCVQKTDAGRRRAIIKLQSDYEKLWLPEEATAGDKQEHDYNPVARPRNL